MGRRWERLRLGIELYTTAGGLLPPESASHYHEQTIIQPCDYAILGQILFEMGDGEPRSYFASRIIPA